AESATWSISASSNTITGAWPPSSMVTRFTVSAAAFSTRLPTGTDPVSVTLRTTGEASSFGEMTLMAPVSRLTTPGGNPAAWQHSTMRATEVGASSAGRQMIEQPAASAGAILRAARMAGKFQAAKAATVPTGWQTLTTRALDARLSTVCPD